MAASNSPQFDRFVAEASRLAQQLGIVHLVIVARDPGGNQAGKVVASPGAMDSLRDVVLEKFGMSGDDTMAGWPGHDGF